MNQQYVDNAEKLLMKLLATAGGSGQEGRVMELIAAELRRAGAPDRTIHFDHAHRRSGHGGQIGNLACKLPGTFRGSRRMLMSHADTVPLCEGARPVRRGRYVVPADKHTALGADDRSGCAVVLAAAVEILRRKLPHPPLTFFWTVQEELGLHGARHARLGMLGGPRLAFNFDGGCCHKLTIGATGAYRMQIQVTGIAAHAGSAPEDGVNAITVASLAIAQLHREGWLGRIDKRGRAGTANVGTIHGGKATNVVTDHVQLRGEARAHLPAFRRQIVRAIERAFQKAVREVRNREGDCGQVHIDSRLDYEAFKLPDEDPSLLASEAAIRHLGGEPVRAICDGGLDANWMIQRGIPTVTLGCGQQHPHTVSERLDLVQFRQACRIALRLATAR